MSHSDATLAHSRPYFPFIFIQSELHSYIATTIQCWQSRFEVDAWGNAMVQAGILCWDPKPPQTPVGSNPIWGVAMIHI